MEWLNKRVRLKPGVNPNNTNTGSVVQQVNDYVCYVVWDYDSTEYMAYTCNLQEVINFTVGDEVFFIDSPTRRGIKFKLAYQNAKYCVVEHPNTLELITCTVRELIKI